MKKKLFLLALINFQILNAGYVSITATENNNVTTGNAAENGVAVGNATSVTAVNAIAIGPNANSSIENGVAIGNGASVNHRDGTAGTGGIAIGKNAQSHQMSSANHEAIVNLNRDRNKMAGGIAIGQDTHARISTVDIGNRDYVGPIGDVNFNSDSLTNTWNYTQAVGATTIGDNSINAGNFGTINGAFNIISTTTANGNSYHNLGKALQGFGSSITGTLNAIEGNEALVGANPGGGFFGNIEKGLIALGITPPATGLIHSGMSSHVIGMANTVNKSNGALILGAGNKITNSYLTPTGAHQVITTTAASFLGTQKGPTIKALADAFYSYMQKARLGSVGIIGGANKADYALFSSINGIGNTLSGKGAASNLELTEKNTSNTAANLANFSAFNQINGYENKGTNVSHTVLTGSWNEVANAENNIITGNNHIIKGTETDKAKGNIVLGFNKSKNAENFKTSAENIVSIGNDITADKDNSVYLGSGSKTGTDEVSKVMSSYTTENFKGLELNFAGGTPTGIVSFGSKGFERRLQNVAAGLISEASTDAINGSQLYSVIKNSGFFVRVGDNGEKYKIGNGDILQLNPNGSISISASKEESTSNSSANNDPATTPAPVPATNTTDTTSIIKAEISSELNELKKDLKSEGGQSLSGIASAMAMANLPQIASNDKYLINLSASYATYSKEHAFAVGLSGINEIGNLTYKLTGSLNTKGKLGLGLGLGYQFAERKYENSIQKELDELKKENSENKKLIEALLKTVNELKAKIK